VDAIAKNASSVQYELKIGNGTLILTWGPDMHPIPLFALLMEFATLAPGRLLPVWASAPARRR